MKLIEQNGKLLEATDKVNKSNNGLIDQNREILKSSISATNKNIDLIGQNKEMLNKIGNYQDDIERKNKLIDSLQNDVANIKKYSDVATLDEFGQDMVVQYPLVSTKNEELISLMKKLYKTEGKNTYVITDLSNIKIAEEVIKKYPTFPFSYYAIAIIYLSHHNQSYIEYAKKAIKIFEVTTTISGHNPSHDQALKYMRDMVKSNF